MSSGTDLLSKVRASPVFVLTSDQDWAPQEAVERLCSVASERAVPIHWFRTNPCAPLDDKRFSGVSQGWHPNFLAGSSHGSTIPDVIAYCHKHFPAARTVRTHAFYEDTFAWRALARSGIVADSQLATFCEPELRPIRHWTGIVRFPVFFEDDIFFDLDPTLDLQPHLSKFFTPGIKILNFHATFVAYNVPSLSYYADIKRTVFATQAVHEPSMFPGRGTLDVLKEVLDAILAAGHPLVSF